MKLFGYTFRKFEETTTTLDAVETWVVKWWSLHKDIINNFEPKIEVQTFINKDHAYLFSKELYDARRLLGDKGAKIEVYKQNSPTNASK